jgi:Family of unknown function (DUF6519)
MKGDFTRDTFDPTKHYSRVLMQQGRVTLDADSNEQTSVLLHYLRTLAADLIGPYAAPVGAAGFVITYDTNVGDLMIGTGRYYVDGILVENDTPCPYQQQVDCPLLDDDPLAQEITNQTGKYFWAYLDVWERYITYIEDDGIREVALNGPDTCTRAKVVWQVKALPPSNNYPDDLPGGADSQTCSAPLGTLTAVSQATMAARVDPGPHSTSACVTPPDSDYRGAENQLYRVEIHTTGSAGAATFKWSRDNGSVVTAWLGSTGNDLQVLHGRRFAAGNWVELSSDTLELQGLPGTLVQLTKVQGDTLTIDPTTANPASGLAWVPQLINPKVRRWDQVNNDEITLAGGAVRITEKPANGDDWIDLENGIQIEFSPGGQYRTGDYWLIPARVATGNIEWPPLLDASGNPELDSDGNPVPEPIPPDGIEHHYAPLGFLSLSGKALTTGGCQCTFAPASPCFLIANKPFVPVRPLGAGRLVAAREAEEQGTQATTVKKRRKRP